jgi:hypothetical protein
MRRWDPVARLVLVMVAGLAGAGALPGAAGAASVRLSLGELTAEADTVVLGTVTSRVSAWNAQRTAIHTDVTVAVEQVAKGAPGPTVTFRIAGGEVGGVGMRTSNGPVFADGERVVVFVRAAGATAAVVGESQGKLAVRGGQVPVDGRMMAVVDLIDAIRAVAP